MKSDNEPDLENVVPLFPDSPETIISKAKQTAEAGDYDDALKYLQAAVQANNSDISKQALILAARGYIFMKMERYAEAYQDFRASRSQLLYVQQGLDNEAMKELEKDITAIAESENEAMLRGIESKQIEDPGTKATPSPQTDITGGQKD